MGKLFGTDGIRGRAGEGNLTAKMAAAFGRAVAVKFGAPGRPIVIGRDTRESGPELEQAVAGGVAAMGRDVVLLAVVPTPAIAFLTRHLGGSAGIVISASHNPYEDNGLKLFTAAGLKCDDATELEMESLILGDAPPAASAPGTISTWPDAATRYAKLAVEAYGRDLDLRGLKVVVDAGHGAAYETTPLVLRALGAEVVTLNAAPDGRNINANCGSTHPEAMAEATAAAHAQLGLAHDGDADRLIVSDETGSLLDGDEMLAVIGLDLLREGRLAKSTLVATVMSNLGLDECFAAAGGKVLRAGVGDRYVLEQMLAHDLNLGGEQSGHGARAAAHHETHRQAAQRIAPGPAQVPAATGQRERAGTHPAGANPGDRGRGEGRGERARIPGARVAALFRHGAEDSAARGNARRSDAAAGRRPVARADPEASWGVSARARQRGLLLLSS
jgi:phosphoglucosamine mutase